MACRDEGQGRDHDANVIREQQTKLDELTKMLCGVLSALEEAEEPVQLTDLSKETQLWWSRHKAADANRRAYEDSIARRQKEQKEAREQALAKLTLEERQLLGVK